MSLARDSAVARLKLAEPDSSSMTRIDKAEFFCEYCPPQVSLVGKSPEIIETLKTIRQIAQSRCNPVLILGESGTGKELAARAIHVLRGGGDGDFVAVNCAALTANLLESELFGHVRGSFTGADRDKTGLFEAARNGSILLDEISEMPPELQAKLLRVIQERKFRKVGGTKDIPCHATIIASSNRDLLSEVTQRRFRKDLYYRLAVFPIRMPALRSPGRACDILLLARFFLQSSEVCRDSKIEGITPAAEQFLLSHDWPGNVRELRNVIDRALIIETAEQIRPESIIIDRPNASATDGGGTGTEDLSLETAEREFIARALKETGWQRTRAAGLLGITRATLHSKLKRYGIKPPGSEIEIPTNGSALSSDEPLREACA